jgi:hypothetical protein
VRNWNWAVLCLYNSDKKFDWVLYCIRIDFLISTFGGLYENHAVQSGISVTFLKSGEHDSSNHFQTHIKQCKTSISILNTEIGNKFRFVLGRMGGGGSSIIGAARTEGEATELQLSAPKTKFKKHSFVDTIISTVLCDIHFKT